MNKYKVGNKFIVEIEEIYNGDLAKHEEHMHLYRIKGFNSLVLDEYGLDKLQKYDEEVIATKFYEKGRQEALEDVQKTIKVGDVVFNDREDVKAVIIDSAVAKGAWQVYTEDCCVELWKECEFKKTGRTVDIEHLLEQIRGNV